MSALFDVVRRQPVTIMTGMGRYGAGWVYARDHELAKEGAYIDMFCDCGAQPLGHNSKPVRKALKGLKDVPIHISGSYTWDYREDVAAQVLLASGYVTGRVFFSSSGAEAVETAFKVARKGTGKTDIWCADGAAHGRTFATLAAGSGPGYYFEGFGEMPAGFPHFVDTTDIDWNTAAGVLICPIRTPTNDIIPYSRAVLRELRIKTQDHGIPLIFDEIQTGAGRCGSYLYAHDLGIQPDIVCLGKGFGMGAPVTATIAGGQWADVLKPGQHYTTFSANGIALHMVESMLSWLHLHPPEARANTLMDLVKEHFGSNIPVRGAGMMAAFDVDVPLPLFARECRRRGVLVPAFRTGPGAVKLYPPLNISAPTLRRAFQAMSDAYVAAKNEAP